jgi:hypothetical protein
MNTPDQLYEAVKLLSEIRLLVHESKVQFTGDLHGGIWTWPDRVDLLMTEILNANK